MFPPERKKMDPKDYEQVKVNDLLKTTIELIEYDEDHLFKGYEGNPDTNELGIRFKLILDGYKFPKKTRWMKFSMDARSNLFSKFLKSLVEGIKENSKFDLDHLIGMKVKTLWEQNGEYQNLKLIVPEDKPILYTDIPASTQKSEQPEQDEETVPF